jgi:hypothetical protein
MFSVCVCMSAQGVLLNVYDLVNRSKMESFVEAGQGPNWGCIAKEKKKSIYMNM